MIWWLLGSFAVGLLGGIPVAFSLMLGVVAFIVAAGKIPLDLLAAQMYQACQSFPIMAVPFFMLAGDLMERTGITARLIAFAKLFVGRFRGGLAHAMVASEVVVSGITGSGVADTAALCRIMVGPMEKEGYPRSFTAALAAAAGVMGPIIPPSIVMIVYGAVMQVSVGALFVGGIVPGVILALAYMLTAYLISVRRNFPRSAEPLTVKRFLRGLADASLALIMPVIILWGIRGGVFTPTEGGAIAVAYSILVGLVYRTLNLRGILESLVSSATLSATILVIIAAANPFGWLLTLQQVPQKFAAAVLGHIHSPYAILLAMNVLLLILGALMETIAVLLLALPVLGPVAVGLGVNPLHLGVVMIINLSIGLILPPVGETAMVASGVAGVDYGSVIKDLVPFTVASIAVLLILTYLPQVTLWLPRVLGFAAM